MKQIKLITFELPSMIAYLSKLVAIIATGYFAHQVYIDFSNEFVVRRGTEYSLDDSPTSFSLTIIKKFSFITLSVYLAFWGIKVRKKDKGK